MNFDFGTCQRGKNHSYPRPTLGLRPPVVPDRKISDVSRCSSHVSRGRCSWTISVDFTLSRGFRRSHELLEPLPSRTSLTARVGSDASPEALEKLSPSHQEVKQREILPSGTSQSPLQQHEADEIGSLVLGRDGRGATEVHSR